MSEIWLAILILLFLVFLVIGLISYFKKSGKKLVYFALAVFNLIGALLMVAIIHWDLSDIGKVEKTSSPHTEINKKEPETQTDDEKISKKKSRLWRYLQQKNLVWNQFQHKHLHHWNPQTPNSSI